MSACLHAASSILKNIDSSVDPCDNFYQFVCGKFLKEAIISDSETSVGISDEINKNLEKQLQLIIPDGIKDDDSPVFKSMKTYYETCMDTDQIEKNSEKDLREVLQKLGGCPVLEGQSWNETNFDWEKAIYESNKMGYSTNILVAMFIDVDPNDSSKRIITIDQAETQIRHDNLTNGRDDGYIKVLLPILIETVEFLGADRKDAEKEIDDSLDFEMELAKISLSRAERRDETKLKNRMTLEQLENNYPGIVWTKYINEILAPYAHIDPSEEINVAAPSFLKSLPALIAKTPKRVLANYLCIRTIGSSMEFMGEELLNIKHKANIVFSGVQEQKSRSKMCFEMITDRFYPAISRLYVKHYFDKTTKTKATILTKNIRNILHQMIQQVDWMDNTTKIAALNKLTFMKSYVGYPNELDSDEKINEIYQNLTLNPKSFLKSEIAFDQLRNRNTYSHFRKPTNGTSWISYVDVIQANAAYTSTQNSIELKAGILQAPFYNSDLPNYVNYGAIGSVIGHELSHGFDDSGSKYDEKGNLANWWKNETREKYLERIQCIIEQYGNYTVKEINKKIDGVNTQSENIADNVGVKAAYSAYNKWTKINSKEPQLPGLNYTPQQMFWISFANTWCEKIRPEKLKQSIYNDEHSPAEFRVVGALSNMPEFSTDFQCSVESSMNPTEKCSIW